MWHAAAALLVNPDLGVVVAVGSDEKDSKGVVEIRKFLTDIGMGNRFVEVDIKPSKTVFFNGDEVEAKSLPGKPLAWQYLGAVQKTRGNPENNTYHLIYRSTSFIMRAIEDHGKELVLRVLGAGLTFGLGRNVRKFVVDYAAEVLEKFKGKKVLFVLGRVAKYNPQHDLNPDRLSLIAKAATQEGFELVIIGWAKEIDQVAKEAGVKNYTCVDLRDWATLTGVNQLEERARAYFWRCVVALAKHKSFQIQVKLVGGRSGSTDIAAFMGVDVLSWDVFNINNPEYLRLLITAPCLLQVTHTDEYLAVGTAVLLRPSPQPQFFTDLCDFMSSKFKPSQIVFGYSHAAQKKFATLGSKRIEVLKTFVQVLGIICVVHQDAPLSSVDTRPKALEKLLLSDKQEIQLNDLFLYLAYGDGVRRSGLSEKLLVAQEQPLLELLSSLDLL